MKKYLFFYLILNTFLCCTYQDKTYQCNKNLKLKSPIKEIVDNLMFESGFNYLSNSKNYINLINVAKEKDLILLTDHPNPTIRCYAFQGLIEKNYVRTNSILLHHLYDNQEVKDANVMGCIKTYQNVNSFMFRKITSDTNYKYKLDPIEYLKIEKIIFDKD